MSTTTRKTRAHKSKPTVKYITPKQFLNMKPSEVIRLTIEDAKKFLRQYKIKLESWVSTDKQGNICSACLGGLSICSFSQQPVSKLPITENAWYEVTLTAVAAEIGINDDQQSHSIGYGLDALRSGDIDTFMLYFKGGSLRARQKAQDIFDTKTYTMFEGTLTARKRVKFFNYLEEVASIFEQAGC